MPGLQHAVTFVLSAWHGGRLWLGTPCTRWSVARSTGLDDGSTDRLGMECLGREYTRVDVILQTQRRGRPRVSSSSSTHLLPREQLLESCLDLGLAISVGILELHV